MENTDTIDIKIIRPEEATEGVGCSHRIYKINEIQANALKISDYPRRYYKVLYSFNGLDTKTQWRSTFKTFIMGVTI